MSTATKYASALQQYNQYLMNTQQKIMQERSIHGQELSNVYMEAVSNGAPAPYLSMLEAMIADRSAYSTRKTFLDAAELTKHSAKLNSALGSNVGVLTGGASGLAGGSTTKQAIGGLAYASKRSNALLENMFTKLAHDRSVHLQELQNLHAETLAAYGGSSPMSALVNQMASNRSTYNARKTALDAMQWTQLRNQLQNTAGMKSVLAAGEKKV
jgi:hypothetical protein